MNESGKPKQKTGPGLGIVAGAVIDMGIGVAMGNIAMGTGVGLAIGIALGLATDGKRRNG